MIRFGRPLISTTGQCSFEALFDFSLIPVFRGTNNLEWYSPEQLTTENGHLKITLANTPNHGLQYMGGMMSTWNKFCFTGGIIVTSVVLPGKSSVYGLWVRNDSKTKYIQLPDHLPARYLDNG
jgi:beta-glucanase (GH16 family)